MFLIDQPPEAAASQALDKINLALLRDWHERQVMHCAKRYAQLAKGGDESRFDYLKAQAMHIRAVSALNTLDLS